MGELLLLFGEDAEKNLLQKSPRHQPHMTDARPISPRHQGRRGKINPLFFLGGTNLALLPMEERTISQVGLFQKKPDSDDRHTLHRGDGRGGGGKGEEGSLIGELSILFYGGFR